MLLHVWKLYFPFTCQRCFHWACNSKLFVLLLCFGISNIASLHWLHCFWQEICWHPYLQSSVHHIISASSVFSLPVVLSSSSHNVLWYQFSSVAQSCLILCYPMNRSTPGLPVHHQLPEFTQTHVHRVCDAIQPSHLLLSPSPPAPNASQHQSLFQWVNSSHEVAKVLEFQL